MKRLIVGLLLLSMVGVASADATTCEGLHGEWKEFEKFMDANPAVNSRD